MSANGNSSEKAKLRAELWHKLLHLPGQLFMTAMQKAGQWLHGVPAVPLTIPRHELNRLRRRLQSIQASYGAGQPAADRPIRAEDHQVIAQIRRATAQANLNNVTRTAAYYDVYKRHPELHWALLAHTVSRNSGWNMTDLKGELLPRLLTAADTEALFAMLEKANALIFQDAYPQLLLYAESRRTGRSLFHLLPQFHVSRFMEPVWDRFWITGCSPLVTVSLIINEQHYIEQRVIQQPEVRRDVLDAWFFQTQSLLQLNQVVFPYECRQSTLPRLAGIVVDRFESLKERIEIGKALYAMLFGLPQVLQGVQRFAAAQPHTGSRADVWPQLFTRSGSTRSTGDVSQPGVYRSPSASRPDLRSSVRSEPAAGKADTAVVSHRLAAPNSARGAAGNMKRSGSVRSGATTASPSKADPDADAGEYRDERLLGSCRLRPGAAPLYSPELTAAWPNRPLPPVERFDWCSDLSAFAYLNSPELPDSYEMTSEYCYSLQAIELAVIGKKLL
ncbi:DUF2515 family protein [Paenibacillus sp. y28]|uniref:DUF2515 family protein n=1 Tax=Paenibacillus sp. y28 TaxID=3129110 RepID=UPI00301953F4